MNDIEFSEEIAYETYEFLKGRFGTFRVFHTRFHSIENPFI